MKKNELLKGIDAALRANALRHAKKNSSKKTTYKKRGEPEKDTEKDIKKWAKKNGFDLYKTDAKGDYCPKAGRFLRNPYLEAGHSDFTGNCPLGTAAFIEAKAKGSRTNLSLNQYRFLKNKVNTGCFAVVVDDVKKLDFFYKTWVLLIRESGQQKAKEFLMDMLPTKKKFEEGEI